MTPLKVCTACVKHSTLLTRLETHNVKVKQLRKLSDPSLIQSLILTPAFVLTAYAWARRAGYEDRRGGGGGGGGGEQVQPVCSTLLTNYYAFVSVNRM